MSLLKHMERWKDIKEYEGLYQVSNFGRVKSLRFGKEKILKPGKHTDGYFQVKLYKDDRKKTFKVHRLVANAFIPNPQKLPQVNHKDENPKNNYVSNLEWCDNRYNSNYGTRNERVSKNLINHPSLSKQVICVETNIIFPSAHEAARKTGVNITNISKCCLGKRKTAGKFHWKFV